MEIETRLANGDWEPCRSGYQYMVEPWFSEEHATLVRVERPEGAGGIREFRVKPQPRYVTKNVQDVRVGDVVKDIGKVSIIHHYEDMVHLFGPATLRAVYDTMVKVEVRD